MNNERYSDGSRLFRLWYLLKLVYHGIGQRFRLITKYGISRVLNAYQLASFYQDELGMIAIVKDEATYIEEWIEYHRLIGVSKFYIFDNGSTDGLEQALTQYIKSGLVIYRNYPGENMQERAYKIGIDEMCGRVRWVLTLDIDEFLQPVANIQLNEWLAQLPNSVSQVEFGWMIFGSNGIKTRPSGLVIENYTAHASDEFIADYKPVVRPERVLDMHFPHEYDVVGKTINDCGHRLWAYPPVKVRGSRPASRKIFRVNHYYSKSEAEFWQKSQRGDASVSNREPRNQQDFDEHDQNVVRDQSMLKYAEQLKEQGIKGYLNENDK
ncbi:glycosyltransferase family 2 protein [Furfurilactobacillus sp. WILCCON 0119]